MPAGVMGLSPDRKFEVVLPVEGSYLHREGEFRGFGSVTDASKCRKSLRKRQELRNFALEFSVFYYGLA